MIHTDTEHAQVVRIEGLLRQAAECLDTSPYQGERGWREFLLTNHRGQHAALCRELTEYERLRRRAGLRPAPCLSVEAQHAKIHKVDLQIRVIERSFAGVFNAVQQIESEYPVNVVKLAGARQELALHAELLAAWRAHHDLLEQELKGDQQAG
jgi:hypothetical protein